VVGPLPWLGQVLLGCPGRIEQGLAIPSSILQIRVELLEIEPRIWRRLQVAGRLLLLGPAPRHPERLRLDPHAPSRIPCAGPGRRHLPLRHTAGRCRRQPTPARRAASRRRRPDPRQPAAPVSTRLRRWLGPLGRARGNPGSGSEVPAMHGRRALCPTRRLRQPWGPSPATAGLAGTW
jgi:hypothetical protein